MTSNRLHQGCFGSALFFDVNSPECQVCRELSDCGQASLAKKPVVLAMVASLDTVFSSEKLADAKKWFARSHIQNHAKQRSESKYRAVLDGFKANDINVYHLKHGTNPVEKESVLRDIFGFMLESGPFKQADVVEHLRGSHDESKASLTRQVKEVCEALLLASVLKKEKNILCLA